MSRERERERKKRGKSERNKKNYKLDFEIKNK
jgi:hypothetical protein